MNTAIKEVEETMQDVSSDFLKYRIRLDFTERVMGGKPANPEIINKWLEARQPNKKPEGAIDLETLGQQVEKELPDIAEEAEGVSVVFLRDEEGYLFVENFTVKAHLADCARVIGQSIMKAEGIAKRHNLTIVKVIRSKFKDRCFIKPRRIYLLKNGQRIQGAAPIESWYEHPIQVMTPMGPRSALKANEFVSDASIEFDLLILDNTEITIKLIKRLLDYGSLHGYGAERGMGYGTYEYEVEGL